MKLLYVLSGRKHTSRLYSYLEGSENHHLLLCTVDDLQQDSPASLFIQLSQTHLLSLQGTQHVTM